MEHKIKNESDADLSRLLKTWEVTEPLPPRFQERVWRRIGQAEKPSPGVWLQIVQWWAGLLCRPAYAVAYCAAFLAVGLIAGAWSSESYGARTEQAWRTAYLQSVTPTAVVRAVAP